MHSPSSVEPVDFVISWVDGNDPAHRQKLARYTSKVKDASCDDVAGDTRFANIGEINYCVASIHRFARFARQIFIITDNQNPHLEEFLSQHFDDLIPIRIIDHSVIFKGYEEYLPTFNSRAIEAMMWRIPGLSERFVYLNDDFLFVAPCTVKDFFEGDSTVCYADWYPTYFAKFLRFIKPKKNGHKPVGFKDSMLNAISITGSCFRFLYLAHTPRALRRSFFEKFFNENPDVLIRNIRHKFRDAEQYNSQELFYMTEHRSGRCLVRSPKTFGLYLKPRKGGDYVRNKLERFDRNHRALFCCFNSLDQASIEDRKLVMEWISRRISL